MHKEYPGACLDQYVGKISDFDPNGKDFPQRLPIEKRPNDIGCVILILESPHKEEFRTNPFAPAMGPTGRNIRKFIRQIEGMETYANFGLILMNAIQYQCSLGIPPTCMRDEVFRAVWQDTYIGMENFQERLRNTYRENDIVVNCCTSGVSGERLSNLVQIAIIKADLNQEIFPERILRRNHPSSWQSPVSRMAISD